MSFCGAASVPFLRSFVRSPAVIPAFYPTRHAGDASRSAFRAYGGNLKSFGNINLYYDLSGRRIKKVNGNKVTHYLYDEQGRLLREKFDGSDVPYITYMYDSSGAVGFMLPYAVYDLGKRHISERPFYYVKDLTGNIRRIVDSNGKCVIKYDYDAWGRVINTEYSDTLYTIWENAYFNAYSIGQLNSLIYKDYYYDKDLELYYLQTRYYDPTVCRFISPDDADYLDYESINGLNLYAYCLNSPVMGYDPDGHWAMPNWAKWLIGGVVILGLGIATIATGGAAAGVAGFIVAGAFKGAVIGAISGALVSGTIGGITSTVAGNGFWSGFADGAADGFMSGAIVGGITGAISSSAQIANAAKSWDAGTYRSAFRSMQDHYQRKIVQQGLNKGYNIVKYTQDAVEFANRNARILSLVPNYKGLQHAWTLNTKYFGYGWNGLFTAAGKIITFGIW